MAVVAYSMGRAERTDMTVNDTLNNPGPGAYNAPEDSNAYRSAPSWKMGTSTRQDIEKQKLRSTNFPSPDCYKPNFQTTRERMASFSFSTGSRSNFGSSIAPGPGQYNQPQTFGATRPASGWGSKTFIKYP